MLVVAAILPTYGLATPVTAAAWQRALAGAGAYVIGTVATSPVDVIKTRQQAIEGHSSPFEIAWDMMRKEGMMAFYSGLAPALMMAPAAIVQCERASLDLGTPGLCHTLPCCSLSADPHVPETVRADTP